MRQSRATNTAWGWRRSQFGEGGDSDALGDFGEEEEAEEARCKEEVKFWEQVDAQTEEQQAEMAEMEAEIEAEPQATPSEAENEAAATT